MKCRFTTNPAVKFMTNSLGNCNIIDRFKLKNETLTLEFEFSLLLSIVVLKLLSNDSFKNELLPFLWVPETHPVRLSCFGVCPVISIEAWSFLMLLGEKIGAEWDWSLFKSRSPDRELFVLFI